MANLQRCDISICWLTLILVASPRSIQSTYTTKAETTSTTSTAMPINTWKTQVFRISTYHYKDSQFRTRCCTTIGSGQPWYANATKSPTFGLDFQYSQNSRNHARCLPRRQSRVEILTKQQIEWNAVIRIPIQSFLKNDFILQHSQGWEKSYSNSVP